MVYDSDLVSVPSPLVAEMVTVNVPVVVGVPEITPVLLLILKPAGKPFASNEVGVLDAMIE
jgi:hypothetical protein